MKIKITGLPEYQTKGLVNFPGVGLGQTIGNMMGNSIPFMKIPTNPKSLDGMQMFDLPIDMQMEIEDNLRDQKEPDFNPFGNKKPEPPVKFPKDNNLNPQPKDNSFGMALASTMGAGLSFLGNTFKANQLADDQNTFSRMYGQTDASNPVVRNAYSRGRNVMNTGEFAPNMMTPVQFAGRPSPEFTGYPTYPYNIYAQDGLSVSRDLLGMSPLYSDQLMLPNLNPGDSLPVENFSPERNDATDSSDNQYVLPVKDFKISSGFGLRKSPKAGASHNHNGVDLAVPVNSPVFAPMEGVVENIYENEKGGKQLIIRHLDGSKSGFAHLNGFNVSVGQSVTKGQKVALSGNTGISTGAHLHFTFRNPRGEFVDPVDFFNLKGSKKSREQQTITNWDHNNPGNIHIGDFAGRYGAIQGRKDAGGNVAIFPTMEAGIQAMQDLIFSPNYLNLTVSQARNRWVNGKPDIPSNSSKEIVKALGADVPLNQLNSEQRKKLVEEFTKWEDRSVYEKLKKQGYFEQGGVVKQSPFNNNSMKIRITGTPDQTTEFADGGRTVGDQMGYGLFRGQSVRDFDAFYKQDEDDFAKNVRSTETGVPRSLANIEAEKGEKVIAQDGMSIMDIKGKKHSQGGTPMDAEPGSYIVSDFLTAPKVMQKAMGFDIPSKRKKDNTWSKVLDSKVKSKDYNKLSQILQTAASGKEVDRFELATAKSKMPVYQDYLSKAVLGNELTKMLDGKPYEIPEMAIPAMMKLFPEQVQQMQGMMQEAEPDMMAKYGKQIPQYQNAGSVPSDAWPGIPYPIPAASMQTINTMDPLGIGASLNRSAKYPWFTPFTRANTEAGRITRGGKKLSSLYDASVANQYQDLEYWVADAEKQGKKINNIEDLQKHIYSELEKDPSGKADIDMMWRNYGATLKNDDMNIENFSDNKAGKRTGFLMSRRKNIPQQPGTLSKPTDGPQKSNSQTKTNTVLNTRPNVNQEEDLEFVNSDVNTIGKRPYLQDIINFGNAVTNQYAYPNIGPYMARYNPVYMDPSFVSTEAIQRLIQSQGRTAMDDASLYGANSQTQAARQAQINAQSLPAMIQNAVQTNAQNLQSDMMARQYNAQVANQAALYDAERATMLSDKNASLAQNRAKEKIAGRTAAKNMLNQLITNAGDTYMMNQWYPQYAFDPLTYATNFKGGKGLNAESSRSSGSGSKTYAEAYEEALVQAKAAHPNDPKKQEEVASKLAFEYLKSLTSVVSYDPRQAMMNQRRMVRQQPRFGDADDETNLVGRKKGGFVPMYYVGGWY